MRRKRRTAAGRSPAISVDLPRIGVFHAPSGAANLRDIARGARGLCQPVIIFRDAVASANADLVAVARRLFDTVIVPGTAASDALRGSGLAGVTTFQDGELDHVDRVADDLGLSGPAIQGDVWDKLRQRQYLREQAATAVHARGVDSVDAFEDAVVDIGLPAVLKQRRGDTSAGVAFIDSPDDVAYQRATRQRWSGLLLESRILTGCHPSEPGRLADYVSVETINTDTQHHVAVFDKTPVSVARRRGIDGADSINETGHLIPSRLPPLVTAEVLDYTSRCLRALGVRWRVTHTEVKLTPYGPEVIEVNGRTAGYLARLLRLVGAGDLIRAALGLAIRQEAEHVGPPTDGAAMLLVPPFPHRGKIVRSNVSVADLRPLPAVAAVDEVAARGQRQDLTGYRMATIVLHASSAAELDEAADRTLRAVEQLFADDIRAPATA